MVRVLFAMTETNIGRQSTSQGKSKQAAVRRSDRIAKMASFVHNSRPATEDNEQSGHARPTLPALPILKDHDPNKAEG